MTPEEYRAMRVAGTLPKAQPTPTVQTQPVQQTPVVQQKQAEPKTIAPAKSGADTVEGQFTKTGTHAYHRPAVEVENQMNAAVGPGDAPVENSKPLDNSDADEFELPETPKASPNIWYEYLNGQANLFGVPMPSLVVSGERDLDKYIQMAQMKDPRFEAQMEAYKAEVKRRTEEAKARKEEKEKKTGDERILTQLMRDLRNLDSEKKTYSAQQEFTVNETSPDGTATQRKMNGLEFFNYKRRDLVRQIQEYASATGRTMPIAMDAVSLGDRTAFEKKEVQNPLKGLQKLHEWIKGVNGKVLNGDYDKEKAHYDKTGEISRLFVDDFDRMYNVITKLAEGNTNSSMSEGERIRSQYASIPDDDRKIYNKSVNDWYEEVAKVAESGWADTWTTSQANTFTAIKNSILSGDFANAGALMFGLLKDNTPKQLATTFGAMKEMIKKMDDYMVKMANTDRPRAYRWAIDVFNRELEAYKKLIQAKGIESFSPEFEALDDLSDGLYNYPQMDPLKVITQPKPKVTPQDNFHDANAHSGTPGVGTTRNTQALPNSGKKKKGSGHSGKLPKAFNSEV